MCHMSKHAHAHTMCKVCMLQYMKCVCVPYLNIGLFLSFLYGSYLCRCLWLVLKVRMSHTFLGLLCLHDSFIFMPYGCYGFYVEMYFFFAQPSIYWQRFYWTTEWLWSWTFVWNPPMCTWKSVFNCIYCYRLWVFNLDSWMVEKENTEFTGNAF